MFLSSAWGAQAEDSSFNYAGSDTCVSCHADQSEAWASSHHASAMLDATRVNVRAPFEGERFESDGVTTEFFQKDDRFIIRTVGHDGQMADFEVAYTFGFDPLQQYLIALPDGRYQAFFLAWDTRPKEEDGQRWFDLYPDREIRPGDLLHWSGIDQTWNYQCASCHSTDLRKNYDPESDTFDTSFAEINVGCESCHGPASGHLDWAQDAKNATETPPENMGFALKLRGQSATQWNWGTGPTVQPMSEPHTATEMDVCANCHSRRGQFSDAHPQTKPFLDAFRPALIDPGLYYADGQQQDEVFKWASFLQSRMHQAGVTCTNCHDPHTGDTRLEGNTLCAQCHKPESFDTEAHTFHKPETEGALCVNCHMPSTNYMVVDGRHDHSFRIPNPELTVKYNLPNACTNCHTDRDAKWALQALDTWYPEHKQPFQDFAEPFAAFDRGLPGTREAIIDYLESAKRPSIVTASALRRLAQQPSPRTISLGVSYLSASDPLERATAIEMVAQAEPSDRLEWLGPLLGDSSRLVRMSAARALADIPKTQMDASTQQAFDTALAEYIAAQEFDAERPEANTNLATLDIARGDLVSARVAFENALARDPNFVPAIIGLAQLIQTTESNEAAEIFLQKAATAQPESADIAHALGLALVRSNQQEAARTWLKKAARLAPDVPRFAYVYAVALYDSGERDQAMALLGDALSRHPYDRALLQTRLSYQMEANDRTGALETAKTLFTLEPENTDLRDLVSQLDTK